MSKKQTVNTPIEADEQTGELIVRGNNGRFLPGTRSPKPITHENAREMQRMGVLAKRAVVAAAANREVQDVALLDEFGEYAWVADAAINMQRMATTPEAGKAAVLAAEWLVSNAGMSEKQIQNDAGSTLDAVSVIIRDLAQFARTMMDGDVIPMRTEIEADTE